MKTEILNGLSKSTHDAATVKMWPSFVQSTPDGTGEKYKGLKASTRHPHWLHSVVHKPKSLM